MRKLQTYDVFAALRVVRTAEVKEEVKRVAALVKEKEKAKEKIKITDVGIEFILGCLEKLSETNSEQAIYNFLAGPLEMETDEIRTMELSELIEKLKELKELIGIESFKVFFNSLAVLGEKLN